MTLGKLFLESSSATIVIILLSISLKAYIANSKANTSIL